MKAYLRSARIAPKKANIIAMMVRGMRVDEALAALSKTNKKGARLVETLVKSAVANAEHNDKQRKGNLMIKTIIVNQGMAYQRGVPMARGRMRMMNKFMSHISVALGIADGVHAEAAASAKATVDRQAKKTSSAKAMAGTADKKPAKEKKVTSQEAKTPVKDTSSSQPATAQSEVQAEQDVSATPNS